MDDLLLLGTVYCAELQCEQVHMHLLTIEGQPPVQKSSPLNLSINCLELSIHVDEDVCNSHHCKNETCLPARGPIDHQMQPGYTQHDDINTCALASLQSR